MQIRTSAAKHGVAHDDIRHAIRHPIVYLEEDYQGEQQVFIIGPAQDGRFLEIVAKPSPGPTKIIHADELRPHLYHLIP
ncbi:hypothetical protein [Plantibacter sp. YIM 135347]|uniref:hypothetical protein n=1 Tax=Plantibacter sp. YIM 135347 TaxID=3423919 RepID=UPI003D337B78